MRGISERRGLPGDPLFPSIRRDRLSRDAVERPITKYPVLLHRPVPRSKGREYALMFAAIPQPWIFSTTVWTAA